MREMVRRADRRLDAEHLLLALSCDEHPGAVRTLAGLGTSSAAAPTAAVDRTCSGMSLSGDRGQNRVVRLGRDRNGARWTVDGRLQLKFVYLMTTGTDDPTKASLPLHLAANGSVEVGHDTSVLLAGDAIEMLLGENLEQMQGIGIPPVRELMTKLREHSVPVYV
jgi:hypothetical protein